MKYDGVIISTRRVYGKIVDFILVFQFQSLRQHHRAHSSNLCQITWTTVSMTRIMSFKRVMPLNIKNRMMPQQQALHVFASGVSSTIYDMGMISVYVIHIICGNHINSLQIPLDECLWVEMTISSYNFHDDVDHWATVGLRSTSTIQNRHSSGLCWISSHTALKDPFHAMTQQHINLTWPIVKLLNGIAMSATLVWLEWHGSYILD